MEKKIRLYVCGPMSGKDNYNFPAFDQATYKLRMAGYIVSNPADMDRASGYSLEILNNMSKEEFKELIKQVFPRDIAVVCVCDGVAFLPGAFDSKGACAEIACAKAVGIPCQSVEYWLNLVVSERSRQV